MDILCVLHDSDEYGVVRWPLAELARVAGVALKLAKELAERLVLKGADHGPITFTHIPRHAGKDGEPVTLVTGDGPVWFSSRMVRDEWRRKVSGGPTKFKTTTPNTKPRHGENLGDGLGDGASSSTSSSELSLRDSIGASQAKPPRKVTRVLPENFPSEPEFDWARELWLKRGRTDLCEAMADQAAQFRDHHQQHGKRMADWPAAWRTWARNAMDFTKRPHPSQQPFQIIKVA